MPSQNQCRGCRFFLEIPVDGDSKLYCCENPRTKEGPRPIGFVDRDAPACALYESAGSAEGVSRTVVVVAPPAPDRLATVERYALRVTLLLATLAGLASWLYSEVFRH